MPTNVIHERDGLSDDQWVVRVEVEFQPGATWEEMDSVMAAMDSGKIASLASLNYVNQVRIGSYLRPDISGMDADAEAA